MRKVMWVMLAGVLSVAACGGAQPAPVQSGGGGTNGATGPGPTGPDTSSAGTGSAGNPGK